MIMSVEDKITSLLTDTYSRLKTHQDGHVIVLVPFTDNESTLKYARVITQTVQDKKYSKNLIDENISLNKMFIDFFGSDIILSLPNCYRINEPCIGIHQDKIDDFIGKFTNQSNRSKIIELFGVPSIPQAVEIVTGKSIEVSLGPKDTIVFSYPIKYKLEKLLEAYGVKKTIPIEKFNPSKSSIYFKVVIPKKHVKAVTPSTYSWVKRNIIKMFNPSKYAEKYMKYKLKYLNLKKQLEQIN